MINFHTVRHKFNKRIEEETQQWLEVRRRNITGSDLGPILGLSPYKNAQKVADSKVTPSEFISNQYVRMGSILEPSVLQMIRYDLGVENAYLFGSSQYDVFFEVPELRLGVTPDAYIGKDEDNIDIMVELKTSSASKLLSWKDDMAPPAYIAQLASQCLMIGKSTGYLAGLAPVYPDMPAIIVRYEFPDEAFELIGSAVADFWEQVDTKSVRIRSNLATKRRLLEIFRDISEVYYVHGLRVNEMVEITW